MSAPKGGGRRLSQRVKTAKGRPIGSSEWLRRQLNDPYVQEAKQRGYRSRAAFKLIEIDDKVHLLRPGQRVVDLGAAPGGWTQVAVERVKAQGGSGRVVGIDIAEMSTIPGATILRLDFLDDRAPAAVRAALDGPVDVVLSDMAPSTTGHPETDHLRIMNLAETALAFARDVLRPGGAFVAKIFQGGGENAMAEELRRAFATVRRIKPPASRSDSAEFYFVATGFKTA
ncbi:MAG TPA: RlmE family RNA methyltransferase [Alphaproteobacteria bacterium]|nr:RlmE family RNA methyltransferase [Alphaproteobacteria bacterium]